MGEPIVGRCSLCKRPVTAKDKTWHTDGSDEYTHQDPGDCIEALGDAMLEVEADFDDRGKVL